MDMRMESDELQLEIDEVRAQQVEKMKYLGLIISGNWELEEQITE